MHFDTGKIDATLAEIAEYRWDDRPMVVPIIDVIGPSKSFVLTGAEPAGFAMRGSFRRAGIKFGVKVRVPAAMELADWGVSEGRPVPQVPSTAAEARVEGTLTFSSADPIGWSASWRMRWDGADYVWGVRGVSYDAAFDSLVAGVVRVSSGHGAPD